MRDVVAVIRCAVVGFSVPACLGLVCCGTFATRFMPRSELQPEEAAPDEDEVVGAYPFSAVAADVYFMGDGGRMVTQSEGTDQGEAVVCGGFGIVFCLLSIPVDIALDAVFLPADLVAWSLGYHKMWAAPRGDATREPGPRNAGGHPGTKE